MQREAYPQVEIVNLRTTRANEGTFEEVKRYAEGYYRARGYYPTRIAVTGKQYKQLSSAASVDNPNLTYRGIPLEVVRGR